MAIKTVADLVTNAYTSAPIVTSQQYRTERENVQNAIARERSAVSSNPPAMTYGAPGVNPVETRPQGQGSAPFSGSMVAPPRTDYAENISNAERQRTPSGQRVSSQDRINDVVGLVRQGFTNPEELQRYLNVSQAGGLASGYTVDEIRNIVSSNADAVKQGEQYRREAVTGGVTQQLTEEERAMKAIEDLQKQRQQRFNQQQEYLNRQFDQVAQQAQESQRREMGNVNVQLARMGAFTAASGVDYGMKVQERHRRELGEIESRRQGALFNAQDAFEKEELQLAYKNLELAKAAKKERDDAKARQLDELKKYEELRKYQKDDLSKTFEGMIEDGVGVDAIPEGYIEQQYPELTRMDAVTLFNVVKRDVEAKKAKTVADQRKADIDNARDIQTILQKVPLGQTITLGGVEYTGLERGDVKTGTETSSDGTVTFWSYDQNSGKVTTTNLGSIGQQKDGWDLKFDSDNKPWKFNQKTGQLVPAYPSITQETVQQVIPEGSVSPFKDAQGNPRVQCGAFVNDMTGIGVGDSFESKMAKMNLWKAGQGDPMSILEQLKPGDVFTQKLNTWTGHTGMYMGHEIAPNGQILIRAFESNYPKPGVISSTRTIPLEQISGFGRGTKVSPLLQSGPDSPVFATKPKKEDELLSVAEAKTLGVPYGTTKIEAAKKKIMPSEQEATQKPLSGEAAKLKSITESIEPEIDQLVDAFEKNYRGSLTGILTGRDRKLSRLLDQVADKVGRLRSGGAINKDEEARFKRQVASFMDIPFGDSKDAVSSLKALKDEARIVREGISKTKTETPVTETERIRVREKTSGRTGTIDAAEYDSSLYERL